jgi:hypothetical protein
VINTHKYLCIDKYLTHGSGSSFIIYSCRSGFNSPYLENPWVRIRVTHECTRAMPYSK